MRRTFSSERMSALQGVKCTRCFPSLSYSSSLLLMRESEHTSDEQSFLHTSRHIYTPPQTKSSSEEHVLPNLGSWLEALFCSVIRLSIIEIVTHFVAFSTWLLTSQEIQVSTFRLQIQYVTVLRLWNTLSIDSFNFIWKAIWSILKNFKLQTHKRRVTDVTEKYDCTLNHKWLV